MLPQTSFHFPGKGSFLCLPGETHFSSAWERLLLVGSSWDHMQQSPKKQSLGHSELLFSSFEMLLVDFYWPTSLGDVNTPNWWTTFIFPWHPQCFVCNQKLFEQQENWHFLVESSKQPICFEKLLSKTQVFLVLIVWKRAPALLPSHMYDGFDNGWSVLLV